MNTNDVTSTPWWKVLGFKNKPDMGKAEKAYFWMAWTLDPTMPGSPEIHSIYYRALTEGRVEDNYVHLNKLNAERKKLNAERKIWNLWKFWKWL